MRAVFSLKWISSVEYSRNQRLIIATETWFKSYRSNVSIAVNGYDVIRNDRFARKSGGVAVYIKKGIKTKVISSSIGLRSEYLFFEVIFPNSKILFGAYYKAPDVDEIIEFDAVLAKLSHEYSDVVVLGDFNENLFLRDFICLMVMLPTISNSPDKFAVFSQIESGLSNHDILFATFRGPDIVFDSQARIWRNYKAINVQNLVDGVINSNLNDIFNCTDVDSMVEIFNEILVQLLDEHAPVFVRLCTIE